MKKKEEKNKEVTLETILEKIDDVFHSVNVKLTSIDLKLNEHDLQFQKMARRSDRMEVMLKKDIDNLAIATARGFSEVHKEMQDMHTELQDIEERLTNKIQGVERRIDDIADNKANREQLKLIDLRVLKIEKKIGV